MFRRTTRPTDAVEPPEARPVRSLRPAIAAAAVVAAAVVATAVVLPAHEATASSASSLDAHGATRTVRDFLDSSVVDGRTYAA